jgi:hypothetical protein
MIRLKEHGVNSSTCAGKKYCSAASLAIRILSKQRETSRKRVRMNAERGFYQSDA